MKTTLITLAFLVLVTVGCDVQKGMTVVNFDDASAKTKYLELLAEIPKQLTAHFPNEEELGKGWRLAHLSRGLQSSTRVQLEQFYTKEQQQKIREQFENATKDACEEVEIVSGLELLFNDVQLRAADTILVGKDTNSPDIFGIIIRSGSQDRDSIVYFLIYDK
jgi:hypothetical protein